VRHSDLLGALIEDALTTGTMVRFRAAGTSMYPTIRDSEVITISGVSTDEVVRGDVLLCRHDKRLLAHRVVGVTGFGGNRFFELRGDAKSACDRPVGADGVVGRVVSVCRNGRLIRLCGHAARLRYRGRAVASLARSFMKGFRISSRPSS
jgi:signal peptidase I